MRGNGGVQSKLNDSQLRSSSPAYSPVTSRETGEFEVLDKLFIPNLSRELKTAKRQLRTERFYNLDHEIATSVS